MDTIFRGLLQLIASCAATFGFALFMHAPKRAWAPACLIGGIAYTLYWALLQLGLYEPLAMFLGALAGSLLGQYLARRMQMIATIFILLAIIPLVPGLGLYRCMHYLAQEMYSAGADAGVRAMVDVVMISLGIAVGSYMFRMIFRPRPQKKEGAAS